VPNMTAARGNLGLGGMATQNPAAVAITGGTINGVAIGNSVPATGAFTGLSGSVTATGSTAGRTLAARFSDVVNVKDFGAVGDGVTDDTAKMQAAMAALVAAGGGEYFVPKGAFLISDSIITPSNVTVRGTGRGSSIIRASGSWPTTGGQYSFFKNVNHAAVAITDENITIRDLTLDYAAYGPVALPGGGKHAISMRMVRNVLVENVEFLCNSAENATAFLGCDTTFVVGCWAYDFDNCAYDHWTSPKNAHVIGCFAQTDGTAQMVNFNPENTSGSSVGNVADGFVLANNTIISTGATADPIQIEPLGAGSMVRNVSITGNVFKNVYLVHRRNIKGVVISGNVFTDIAGNNSSLFCHANGEDIPDSIKFADNVITNPNTTSGNLAVIRIEGTNSSITGNIISGTNFYAACHIGAYAVHVDGNNFSAGLNGFQVTGSGRWFSASHNTRILGASRLQLLSPTVDLGKTTFTTANNTTNTTTTIAIAAQAAARTYTLPDVGRNANLMLTDVALTAAGMVSPMQLPLIQGHNSNGTSLAATPSAGMFGLNWAAGGNIHLRSQNANLSTIVNTVGWEFVLPPTYKAGTDITLDIWTYYVLGGGVIGTAQLAAAAYRIGVGGNPTSNRIATPPQAVAGTAGRKFFTITGPGSTVLTPGARMQMLLELTLQDTGGSNIFGYIFNVDLW